MSVARFAFGPRLKAHRERQGITLQDIADSTKIGIALLAGLERNDVSQWPKGIFRRAFLRSYARAINVPFEATWAEFAQLFPEDGAAPPPPRASGTAELRLTLVARKRLVPAPSASNVAAAAADLCIALGFGVVVAAITGSSIWTSVAISALLYNLACTTLLGGSLAQRLLRAPRTRQGQVTYDHKPVISGEREAQPALQLAFDESRAESADAGTAPSRPRIVAVTSNRDASPEVRERRVADR